MAQSLPWCPAVHCCQQPADAWLPDQTIAKFSAHSLLELVRAGADELLAIKRRAQAHHMGGLRQTGFEQSTHRVNLPLDGVARDGTAGPTLGHHSAQPNARNAKQGLRSLL